MYNKQEICGYNYLHIYIVYVICAICSIYRLKVVPLVVFVGFELQRSQINHYQSTIDPMDNLLKTNFVPVRGTQGHQLECNKGILLFRNLNLGKIVVISGWLQKSGSFQKIDENRISVISATTSGTLSQAPTGKVVTYHNTCILATMTNNINSKICWSLNISKW